MRDVTPRRAERPAGMTRHSEKDTFTWAASSLPANPVARLDRPPHRREAPTQVPGPALMDALVRAARQRERPRDTALFLILRYTGMRRESVATLQVRHLDPQWGLRGVRVKGGTLRDIPLPSAVPGISRSTSNRCWEQRWTR